MCAHVRLCLATNDGQPKYWWWKWDSSSLLSHAVLGGWFGTGNVLPGVSRMVLCHLLTVLFMASTSGSKGQHLHSRKQEEEETRERERNAKGIHNISVYIPLARTKLHGYTQLQGTLGNVVLILTAMYPVRNPLTKKWRSGMWRGSLCHSLYAAFLNRITVTVDADYRLWSWLWTEIWLHQLLFSSLVYQLGIIIEQTYFIGPMWGLNELMYIKGLSMVPGSKLSARVISLLFLNTSITWVKFYVIACIIFSFSIAA